MIQAMVYAARAVTPHGSWKGYFQHAECRDFNFNKFRGFKFLPALVYYCQNKNFIDKAAYSFVTIEV